MLSSNKLAMRRLALGPGLQTTNRAQPPPLHPSACVSHILWRMRWRFISETRESRWKSSVIGRNPCCWQLSFYQQSQRRARALHCRPRYQRYVGNTMRRTRITNLSVYLSSVRSAEHQILLMPQSLWPRIAIWTSSIDRMTILYGHDFDLVILR